MNFGYQTLGFGAYPNRSSGSGSGSGIAQGLTPSLLTLTGQSNPSAAVNNNTIDLSNVGGVDYTSETARLVFRYEKGSSYTGDIQLYDIEFSSTSYDINSGANNFETTGPTENSSSYTSASFSNVTTSAQGGTWVRDANGTGSSGTGLTLTGEYYFYAETSSPAANTVGFNFWLRSPFVALSPSSPNLTFKDARYGAGIGTLNVHLEIQ